MAEEIVVTIMQNGRFIKHSTLFGKRSRRVASEEVIVQVLKRKNA